MKFFLCFLGFFSQYFFCGSTQKSYKGAKTTEDTASEAVW